jgi:unspecific monooxygenase
MATPYKMELKMIQAQQVIDAVVETELDLLLEEFNGNKPIHPDRKEGSVIASLIAKEPKFRIGGKAAMLAEARILVLAGFDTTAHSLAFAMGMMAERPDLADQMAKQGMNALPDKFYNLPQSESVNSETIELLKKALDKTTFVKHFFMEALRLYPLVPALRGECASNIDIVTKDGTHYTLPKGTLTHFLNVPLQRQAISNPDEICPERWDVPITEQPFLHTFQNGPLRCPGKPLSLLEGHAFLLLIASKFRFEFPKDVTQVQFEDNGNLRPRDSMPLVVKRRNE